MPPLEQGSSSEATSGVPGSCSTSIGRSVRTITQSGFVYGVVQRNNRFTNIAGCSLHEEMLELRDTDALLEAQRGDDADSNTGSDMPSLEVPGSESDGDSDHDGDGDEDGGARTENKPQP